MYLCIILMITFVLTFASLLYNNNVVNRDLMTVLVNNPSVKELTYKDLAWTPLESEIAH